MVNQLNLGFLSKHIGNENFTSLKKAYETISLDGHFDVKITDKKLAVLLFENSVKNDFFENKQNLLDFLYSLPDITQRRIIEELNVSSLNEIKWSAKISAFFIDQFGLSEKFRWKSNTNEQTALSHFYLESPSKKFKKLKEYQSGVFFKLEQYILNTPYSRCILQMPTGSGKTRTAMELVCSVMNNTGKDVLWLANTEELCDQAFSSFLEVWFFLRQGEGAGINHIRTKSKINSNEFPIFHVTSLQSLNNLDNDLKLKKLGIDPEKIELLIVDEAHISIATTYKKTINNIIRRGTKLLGLTATPGRQLKNESENIELSDFYFNKIFEIETGKQEPIEYLRNQGILSNAKFISIEGSKLEDLMLIDAFKEYKQKGVISKRIETILTNNHQRNAIIFDQLVQLINQGKKIIFFATSIAHSEMISTLLIMKGFKSVHLDGNTGKYRSKIIKDFKNGEYQIICNYGVLSTGFDDPKIDVVFMARKTNSIVLYSQIIGRGLRGPLIGGTDTCEIYTIFDNLIDLPSNNKIYSYFENYFIN